MLTLLQYYVPEGSGRVFDSEVYFPVSCMRKLSILHQDVWDTATKWHADLFLLFAVCLSVSILHAVQLPTLSEWSWQLWFCF